MPKIRHKKRWTMAVILMAGLAWWIWPAHEKPKPAAPRAITVQVSPVLRKDIPIKVSPVGNVIAYESVEVRSRLDSQIAKVLFHNGEKVEKGALLFVLDDRLLKASEKQLMANVKRDKAQLNNLREQYQRSIILTKKRFESAANLDQARAAFKAQEAIVGASQAALESIRVQLGYTRITAPISGRTGTINVTAGNTLKANDTIPLVTIHQVTPIWVQMSLPQNVLAQVRAAMQAGSVTVQAHLDGVETPVTGTLEYIDNTVDTATGTFTVRAIFTNTDELLWPGMFINCTIVLGTQNQALVVPEAALQHGQDGDHVFVIEGNTAHKRPVKVGISDQGFVVITQGVKEGETVATDGLMSLKDKATVALPTSPGAGALQGRAL